MLSDNESKLLWELFGGARHSATELGERTGLGLNAYRHLGTLEEKGLVSFETVSFPHPVHGRKRLYRWADGKAVIIIDALFEHKIRLAKKAPPKQSAKGSM